jgi:hypothetical protein
MKIIRRKILQHAIASKSNHSNTMLPNVMVLAPLQKLKIKYELSYQSTTRLKYIDKFDQLLIGDLPSNDVISGDATFGYILKTNNPFLFVLGISIL